MKNLFRHACLAFILCCGAGLMTTARADVKIKTKNTSGGQVSEQTVYIKGKRQRTEHNETSVMILQCDLRRHLQIGVPTKTYVVTPFDLKTADAAAAPGAKAAGQTPASANPVRRGGVVTSTFTTTDTGERKKMFGYTARRIKTSIVTESSPDACNVSRSRMETDGWYIDAQFALDCEMQGSAAYAAAAQAGGCRDEYRTKQIGTAKAGYPVMVTTTLFDEKGNESFTFSQEVVEITNAVLDNALFDAPADYRQVNDVREMYGAPAMASAARDNDGDDDNEVGSGAVKASSAAGAKKPGVVRVGVALTKTVAAADYVDASALADAVRSMLVSNLNNSAVEVVALEAQQTQGVESEAQQKECDYVLYSTVVHKKGGGGGFGGFLKKSAAIAGGVMAPTEVGGQQGGAASSLKARDELTLEYKLQRGADSVVANTLKAKAKSDGDNIIAQLAEQAAAAVRTAAAAATSK